MMSAGVWLTGYDAHTHKGVLVLNSWLWLLTPVSHQCAPWKATMMAHAVGFLPSTSEPWIEFFIPGSSPGPFGHCGWACGSEPAVSVNKDQV